MECEQNVTSDIQKWEVKGKYGKRQKMKHLIAPGIVGVTAKYCKWQGNMASGKKQYMLRKNIVRSRKSKRSS